MLPLWFNFNSLGEIKINLRIKGNSTAEELSQNSTQYRVTMRERNHKNKGIYCSSIRKALQGFCKKSMKCLGSSFRRQENDF